MGHLHGVAGPPARRLIVPAAATSASLSALFLVVYGLTNWAATLRADAGTWCFAWESAIPFVPLMIVPYLSIDAFFVAAPFLCRDRREQAVLARRIAFAIVIAGVFFLAMPLRLAFARVPVQGPLGTVFDLFRGMDGPHNLFPSLHITLAFVLAATYLRHTRGVVRAACLAWFALITFSTVLTHQHQVVDVAGGIVLAGFAFYAFPDAAARGEVTPNRRVGSYYVTGALVLLSLAWPLRPWGLFLIWPGAALGIVAAGYVGLGPGVYRKRAGLVPPSARFVLAPVLAGHYLSLWYYRRQCRAWDEVVPGVLVGRHLSDAEAAQAVRAGVTAVLDLTAEFSEPAAFRTTRYRNVPMLDLTAPTVNQLREAVAFIADQVARGTVYVHCKAGYSRSAAVVAAYLLATGRAGGVEEAVALLRHARPAIIIRAEVTQALREWEAVVGAAQAA